MYKGECPHYKEKGKWIIESRIEFPDPMLMTLDTPHCPNAKLLKKKWPENAGKIKGKIIFPTLWVLNKRLDPNSGLYAKNQREISGNKVRRLLWPLGWGKCGKGWGNGIRREGNAL